MGRRQSWSAQQARMQAAEVRRQAAAARAREVAERRAEQQAKREHAEAQAEEAEERNRELAARMAELAAILASGLRQSWPLDVSTLKRPVEMPPFDAQSADRPWPEPTWEQFAPKAPNFLAKLLPGTEEKFQRSTGERRRQLEEAVAAWQEAERQRQEWLDAARAQHERACERLRAEIADQHAEVDAFAAGYRAAEVEPTVQYFSLAMERDAVPEGFPTACRVAFVPESRQLVIEREIPGPEIVPGEQAWRYVRARDLIEPSARPAAQARATYASVVSQLALRSLHGAFAADVAKIVETVVLNCVVDRINPATGKPERPCLLTVRCSRETLAEHDLARVDPGSCLKHLNAQVSSRPHDIAPVRPIVDFDMVDPRFIEKQDVLGSLDTRPNLAELTPGQFEALITNLFEKMGLETRLTQASRDGGVDCVAWDLRPVIGGKVIVQAKRYKNTVGVSAVRDLYGTVMNEGAAKGILVSTSGYGRAAYEFGNNKPLQLISAGELLYLLEQHTGVRARIEFPDDWADPAGLTEPGPAVQPARAESQPATAG